MAPAAADVGSSQDNDFVLHLSHLHQYLDHNYLPCCWGLFWLKDNHDHYIDWMADTAVAAAVTGNMLDVDVEADGVAPVIITWDLVVVDNHLASACVYRPWPVYNCTLDALIAFDLPLNICASPAKASRG